HRARKSGRECRDLTVRRIVSPDPPAAQVGEEIEAGVLRGELAGNGIVEDAARDRAALGVRVLVDRIVEIRIRRSARAFAIRPTVVRSGDAFVDFLRGVLPDVVDEHPAGPRLDGKGEW